MDFTAIFFQKSKIDGGIGTYKAEEVLKMKQQNVSEVASDIVLMNGNVSGKGGNFVRIFPQFTYLAFLMRSLVCLESFFIFLLSEFIEE